ncbi:MAG TPA: hypothetical protein VNR70_15570 [Steroidobacteraceae bacterium]|jgi:hypothetical protein|nr:hypothetical protein [Steroidobacteraceae bacterium]
MRGIIALLTLVSVGTLYANTSLADSCHGPSAPTNFPDPATATEQDILAAQQSVKQYLTDMESVLKCVDTAHNDHGHDVAVDDMQKTAAKFNTVLRAFRARQKA